MQAGNYSPQFIQGFAGPAKVRAAVFEQDGKLYAFAGVDCCAIDKATITGAGLCASKPASSSTGTSFRPRIRIPGGSLFLLQLELLRDANPAIVNCATRRFPTLGIMTGRCQLATALIMAHKRLEPCLLNMDREAKTQWFSIAAST